MTEVESIKAEIQRMMDEEMNIFTEDCKSNEDPSASSAVVYTRLQMLMKSIDIIISRDDEPFTLKWLKENIDLNDKRFEQNFVQVDIDDWSGKYDTNGQDCGEIQICYERNYYIHLSKGTAYKAWYVTDDTEPDNDNWMPNVVTIRNFKRLFRVVAGFELPLKNK